MVQQQLECSGDVSLPIFVQTTARLIRWIWKAYWTRRVSERLGHSCEFCRYVLEFLS